MNYFRKLIAEGNFLRIALLRNVLFGSLLLTIILPLVTVYYVFPSFTTQLIRATEDDAIRVATHLATLIVPQGVESHEEVIKRLEDTKAQQICRDLGLMKLKIFAGNGEVVFSTDSSDVGHINREVYFRKVVAAGRAYSKFVKKSSSSLEGRAVSIDVVETYVPIIRAGQFLGAFEIYYDVTTRKAQIDKLVMGYSAFAFVLMLALLAGVFQMLSRENRAIRERSCAEQETRRAHAELDQIFETAADGMRIIDRHFDVLRINKTFVVLTGMSESASVGRKCYDGFSGAMCKTAHCPLTRILKGEEYVEYEAEKERADGVKIPCVIRSMPFHAADGSLVGIVQDFRDISERKKAEQERKGLEAQLRRAQKMEAIGTLAGGIAHDFNNILTPIIAHSEMALWSLPEESPVRSRLQEVLKAGQRAKDLVHQILTFSRQTDRQQAIAVQVGRIVKEVLKLLRASLPSTIHIRQELNAKLDAVIADPTHIYQVLMNLCTNAAHAMRAKGGVLEVGLANVSIDFESLIQKLHDVVPGTYVKLTVRDTGHGIRTEIIDRIFDPFFTTKARGEGTGMGLSVVHGIIKDYGGAITVDSSLEVGTTFEVFLPVADQIANGVLESVELLPRGNSERILLIDDEAAITSVVSSMLSYLGYDVVAETSSVSALEAFNSQRDAFDLIITDQTMPVMTGEQLARQIMRIRPNIPIIVCTGYSDQFSEEQAKAIGVRGYVMKPVVMSAIADAIRKALHN